MRTVISFVKWILFTLVVWTSKVAACVVAPIAALPVFVKDSYEDGVKRPQLRKIFYWTTTHDAPADSYYTGTYFQRNLILKRYSREEIANSSILSYIGRVLWIWRNPAYVVADLLGYNQEEMEFIYQIDEGHLWDSGYPNFSFYFVKNKDKKIGWMLEWQWYFYKQRCLEVYLGWKLFRKDENKRCMLVARITPFKKYDKKW